MTITRWSFWKSFSSGLNYSFFVCLYGRWNEKCM